MCLQNPILHQTQNWSQQELQGQFLGNIFLIYSVSLTLLAKGRWSFTNLRKVVRTRFQNLAEGDVIIITLSVFFARGNLETALKPLALPHSHATGAKAAMGEFPTTQAPA